MVIWGQQFLSEVNEGLSSENDNSSDSLNVLVECYGESTQDHTNMGVIVGIAVTQLITKHSTFLKSYSLHEQMLST